MSDLDEDAHTMLPGFDGGEAHRCLDEAPETEEQMANWLAGELMFPWRFFEGDLGFYGAMLPGVEALARRYDASLEQMTR